MSLWNNQRMTFGYWERIFNWVCKRIFGDDALSISGLNIAKKTIRFSMLVFRLQISEIGIIRISFCCVA